MSGKIIFKFNMVGEQTANDGIVNQIHSLSQSTDCHISSKLYTNWGGTKFRYLFTGKEKIIDFQLDEWPKEKEIYLQVKNESQALNHDTEDVKTELNTKLTKEKQNISNRCDKKK